MLTATVTAIQPVCSYLVLDLETGDAPTEAVAAALESWKAPSNIKDTAKIESRRAEAATKFAEKAALLDASPILCIALQSNNNRLVLNGMDASAPAIDGWPCIPCGDERGLLLALREFLNSATSEETTIIGHNVRNFDLPKLRHAYVRHNLKLPNIIKPRLGDETKAEVVDTAMLFKAFSMEHRDDFCPSLDVVASSFGIPRPKQHMSGADCPRLYREGEVATVLTYCCVDVATTTRAYLLMTSTAPDLD